MRALWRALTQAKNLATQNSPPGINSTSSRSPPGLVPGSGSCSATGSSWSGSRESPPAGRTPCASSCPKPPSPGIVGAAGSAGTSAARPDAPLVIARGRPASRRGRSRVLRTCCDAFSRPPTGFSELPDPHAGHDREVESLTNAASSTRPSTPPASQRARAASSPLGGRTSGAASTGVAPHGTDPAGPRIASGEHPANSRRTPRGARVRGGGRGTRVRLARNESAVNLAAGFCRRLQAGGLRRAPEVPFRSSAP